MALTPEQQRNISKMNSLTSQKENLNRTLANLTQQITKVKADIAEIDTEMDQLDVNEDSDVAITVNTAGIGASGPGVYKSKIGMMSRKLNLDKKKKKKKKINEDINKIFIYADNTINTDKFTLVKTCIDQKRPICIKENLCLIWGR